MAFNYFPTYRISISTIFIVSPVPSEPEDIKATSVSQDTILLSWKQPVRRNGEVRRYTVLYCTVLYCTVLYCTVQYCTVLYHHSMLLPLCDSRIYCAVAVNGLLPVTN